MKHKVWIFRLTQWQPKLSGKFQLIRCQLNTNPDISTDTVAVQFDEVTGEPVMYGGRAISSQDHQV